MDAIILAGGIGKRMKTNYPKQFIELKGKPLLIYALEAISKHDKIENLIITYPLKHIDKFRDIVASYGINRVIFVEGGNSRQESVMNALKEVNSKDVMIHEAARPLLSLEFIDEIINSMEDGIGGVVPVIKIPFTVTVGDEFMEEELDRSKLRNVQLPQVFNFKILYESHKKAHDEGCKFTEDGSLVFHYGGKIKFIEGRESNIKVTSSFDIHMVNKLFNIS